MRTRILLLATLALTLIPALSTARPPARQPSPFQFLLEGGAALPQGDLGEPFEGTDRGMGAGTGYGLGARLRFYIGPTTAIAPAFTYVNFADWDDVTGDGTPYSVRTSLFRYGFDIQQFLVSRRELVRPYLTIGGALIHNRYQDWLQDEGTFDASANNLAFTAGGGLAMGPFELSVTWNYNPTELRQLAAPGTSTEFDWSYLMVAGGIAFGD